jgi:hypothetical protein
MNATLHDFGTALLRLQSLLTYIDQPTRQTLIELPSKLVFILTPYLCCEGNLAEQGAAGEIQYLWDRSLGFSNTRLRKPLALD